MSDRKPNDQHKQGSSSKSSQRTQQEMPSQYNRVRVEDLLNKDNGSSSSRQGRGDGRGNRSRASSSAAETPFVEIPCDVPNCKRKFPTKESMIAHKKRSHPVPTAYVCEYCNSSFSTPPNLNKHIRSVHQKVKPFQCDQCSSCFAFRDGLYRHKRMVHEQIRPFQCPYCSLRFKTKSHLMKHSSALHPGKHPPTGKESRAGSSSKR